MAFVIYSNEQDEFGYYPQTTWGTAVADNTAFRRIKFPKGTKIEPYVKHTNLQLNRSVRQPVSADFYTDNFSGPVRITVPEYILTRDRFADLLYGCLQNKVSEGGASVYLKQFKVHATQPDFTANAGYFFTLAYKSPITGNDIAMESCIIKSFELDIDKTGEGAQNLVKVKNLEIISQVITPSQTFSGTWADEGTARYTAFDFTLKFNDSDALDFAKFSCKFDNGAVPLDKGATGIPRTFLLNWPNGDNESPFTANFTSWYNENTTGTIINAMTAYRAGTTSLWSIQTSANSSTTGHIKISFYAKQAANPQGDENRTMTVPFTLLGVHNAPATNDLVIVDMADAIDQTP